MRLRPEEDIQVRVVAELRRAGVRFAHPANESRAPVSHRVKLARMGLAPGLSDLLIFTPPPCGGYVAAALELKSEKGRISPQQREWLDFLSSVGWATACTRGLDESLGQLIEWGYLPPGTGGTVGRASTYGKQTDRSRARVAVPAKVPAPKSGPKRRANTQSGTTPRKGVRVAHKK